MKRFIARLAVIAVIGTLLVAIYAIWFFCYEPINYFGWKAKTELTYDPIWKMKDFISNPSQNIILGNSQVAHINTDTLQKYSGKRFANIAFGGASLKESIDQFWWATQTVALSEVWIAVSFYTLNASYNIDRTENLKSMTSNPVKYMTDKYYIDLAWQQFKGTTPQEVAIKEMGEGQKYRQDLLDYCKVIKGAVQEYRFNQNLINQLSKIGHYCKTNGIRLVFIIPPMHQSIFELVVEPQNLKPYVEKTLQKLTDIGQVYNFEFPNAFSENQDNFFDGFHLTEAEPTTNYIKALSNGQQCDIMTIH